MTQAFPALSHTTEVGGGRDVEAWRLAVPGRGACYALEDADGRPVLPPSAGRFSSNNTVQPCSAALTAAANPLPPPPTTTTSNIRSSDGALVVTWLTLTRECNSDTFRTEPP